MSATDPAAKSDYSKESRTRTAPPRRLSGAALAALGLGMAGAIVAVVATFSTVIEIRSVTVTLDALTGWDRHGPALPLLALFAVLMIAGAWRGARPAMAALAAAGIGILLIALLIDQPHLHDTGRYGDMFEAEAQAGRGWLFETAAGVLMIAGGVLALLLAGRRAPAAAATPAPAPRERERPSPPHISGDDGRSPAAPPAIAPAPPAPAPPALTPAPPAPPPPAPPAPASAPSPVAADWLADDPMASRAQRLTQPAPPPRKRRSGGLVGKLLGRD